MKWLIFLPYTENFDHSTDRPGWRAYSGTPLPDRALLIGAIDAEKSINFRGGASPWALRYVDWALLIGAIDAEKIDQFSWGCIAMRPLIRYTRF